jgi:proteasome assembly chaperone (PAC2) family protein
VFAHLDPEEFFDFQVSRPTVRLEQGVSRVIEWPRGDFAHASVQGRDVILFTSNEPNVRWRTFTETILAVARDLGSPLLITLGAFLTDVPHTRDVTVVGSALDEVAAARLDLARSQYEGPTGIVGVLHDTSIRTGLPSVSLWAAVPHYLPAAPNPKAALALIQRASSLLELPVETATLERAVQEWEESVAKLIGESEELTDYVARLEAAADESRREVRMDHASGESIAAEVERFLRDQDPRGPAS